MKFQGFVSAFLCIHRRKSILVYKTTVHLPGHQQEKFMNQKAGPQPGKPQLHVVALSMWVCISAERNALYLVNTLVSNISFFFIFRRVFHHHSLSMLCIMLWNNLSLTRDAISPCTSYLSHFPALISEVWHKVQDSECLGDLEPRSSPHSTGLTSCIA